MNMLYLKRSRRQGGCGHESYMNVIRCDICHCEVSEHGERVEVNMFSRNPVFEELGITKQSDREGGRGLVRRDDLTLRRELDLCAMCAVELVKMLEKASEVMKAEFKEFKKSVEQMR